jgi:hypothetical protein
MLPEITPEIVILEIEANRKKRPDEAAFSVVPRKIFCLSNRFRPPMQRKMPVHLLNSGTYAQKQGG